MKLMANHVDKIVLGLASFPDSQNRCHGDRGKPDKDQLEAGRKDEIEQGQQKEDRENFRNFVANDQEFFIQALINRHRS